MKTQLAPHCIGQAASFTATGAVCKRCAHSVNCAKQVMTRLYEINKTLDVGDLMCSVQKFLDKKGVSTPPIEKGGEKRFAPSMKMKFEIDVDLSQCSVGVKRIASAILSRGIDIKADIKRGDNKLEQVRPTYLASIQSELSEHGRLTHERIKQLIRQDRPNIFETSISNQASHAAQALTVIGVVEKYGESYVLTD